MVFVVLEAADVEADAAGQQGGNTGQGDQLSSDTWHQFVGTGVVEIRENEPLDLDDCEMTSGTNEVARP